ncbi:MAG: tyrosine-type recombinase/integrase [Methylophaga sp.]|nr:tyrosine-type recombinase/integrase [Methylophaga sp.]
MGLKKQIVNEDEIAIFDEAVIHKRGEYWQFKLWLNDEQKYARKSLRTRSKITAIEKAKRFYLEILADRQAGKRYFTLTTKQGVAKYIEYRAKDVETGLIVSGRLTTIRTHLKHFLRIIGKDTKLRELGYLDCEDYFYKRHKETNGNVKVVTIQNEQSTINACILWLFKNNETYFAKFDFKRLAKVDSNNEALRRATFTLNEYKQLCVTAKNYANECSDSGRQDEYVIRTLIRYFILIAGHSGLRVGELLQLKWNDVEFEAVTSKGKEHLLAKVAVRAETSKVRRSRVLYCKGGEHFKQLQKILKHDNGLIFSTDSITKITKRKLLYHFHKIVALANIPNSTTRALVPYSLRHFAITQRILSGLSLHAVASMCGTSVVQIERTYWHVNNETRLTSALADYVQNDDGTITLT